MDKEQQLRMDLATAFRWAARYSFHEAVANHFSVAVSDDGKEFLLNPRARHFSRVKASELLLVNADDKATMEREDAPDPSAWYLHGHLHKHVSHARCVLHTHMPNTTALSCLKDFEFLMTDQNACRFYNRIAYDYNYNGLAMDDAEGERVASLLGKDKSVLFMGNHGVMVVGETVAQAFDELYYLEKAAEVQVLALSTRQELAIVPDDIAQKACDQWLEYHRMADGHFNELKAILDEEEPSYKE
ncbi:MAG: class II aldolase/adducin family protein [Chloroflexota bacterium]